LSAENGFYGRKTLLRRLSCLPLVPKRWAVAVAWPVREPKGFRMERLVNSYPNGGMEIRQACFAAGGLLMIGWEGPTAQEALELLEEFKPRGLVFFKRNYPPGGPAELQEGLRQIVEYGRKLRGEPFLLAIDNEGGTVRRLPEPFIQLPSARQAAQSGALQVKQMAWESGQQLAQLGFNVNLAPVLDVDCQGNYMDSRSYGSDPEVVSEHAQAFMEGFRQAGLLTCGKHFPGLGAAKCDPHKVLPTVDEDLDGMEKHLSPFKSLISQGIPLIMTTHCLYPALDANRPATFSPKIVDHLKHDLGFTGPVLTDDLQMGAVTNNLLGGEAALAAFEAGHDLILVCRERPLIKAAFDALVGALASGRIKKERLQQAQSRVMSLNSVLGKH
jgi:beta-N-acetylhexosaminidase